MIGVTLISNNSFVSNTATAKAGGAMALDNILSCTIASSTFTGNSANSGQVRCDRAAYLSC